MYHPAIFLQLTLTRYLFFLKGFFNWCLNHKDKLSMLQNYALFLEEIYQNNPNTLKKTIDSICYNFRSISF